MSTHSIYVKFYSPVVEIHAILLTFVDYKHNCWQSHFCWHLMSDSWKHFQNYFRYQRSHQHIMEIHLLVIAEYSNDLGCFFCCSYFVLFSYKKNVCLFVCLQFSHSCKKLNELGHGNSTHSQKGNYVLKYNPGPFPI